jgi:hypothetical protein
VFVSPTITTLYKYYVLEYARTVAEDVRAPVTRALNITRLLHANGG